MNLRRYRAIWRLIERFPEQHDQTTWHCGTSHCVAGWADLVAAGYKHPERICVPDTTDRVKGKLRAAIERFARHTGIASLFNANHRAKAWLKLSGRESDWLFSPRRTKDELRALAETGEFPRGVA